MGDRDDELRAEGRRDAQIEGLQDRVKQLETNLRWAVTAILATLLGTIAQWLQRIGGGQ